ncbi:MAG: hypothetical protein BroJett040_21620 [Oligoflexia bacterium]|nr:MAG: hypothetical protein BroJett040_21620 [Oligoflexia bacterium]
MKLKWLVILFTASFLAHFSQATQDVLQGDWKTECLILEEDVVQSKINIQENIWTSIHTGYEDEKCQRPYLEFRQVQKALVLGADLDLTAIESSYTPLTNEISEALNLIRYCGIETWKMGEAQIVNGKECQDFQAPKIGSVLYTTYKISVGRLYLGRPGKGKRGQTAEDRLSEYETYFYSK